MKTILVYVNNDSGFESRFQAALAFARSFGAHISCLQVTPYDSFVMADPFGGVYALPTVLEKVRERENTFRSEVEERLRKEGVAWDWHRLDGTPSPTIANRSSLCDLIVMSLPRQSGDRGGSLAMVGDVVIHARAPVLAVPEESTLFDCLGPAMVAWNGSAEASHALRLTLPILARASEVHVVTVSEAGDGFPATDACQYLDRHGVAAQLHEWARDGRSIGEVLREAAAVLRAGYVTMGAYGHSRMSEAVLGGATREMLQQSNIPLLLAH